MASELEVSAGDDHPTRALTHLHRLTHDIRLLEELVGGRPMWPAMKANAYGHVVCPARSDSMRISACGATAKTDSSGLFRQGSCVIGSEATTIAR